MAADFASTLVYAVWNVALSQWKIYPGIQTAIDTEGSGCIIYSFTPQLVGTGIKTIQYGTK